MAVARAAQCAADQGKFWDYRRNLLEAPGDWTDPASLAGPGGRRLSAPVFAAAAIDKPGR